MSGGPLDRFLIGNKNTQKRPSQDLHTDDSAKKKRREDDDETSSSNSSNNLKVSGGLIKKQVVRWSWLQEGQQWKEYSPDITKKLEDAVNNNKKQCAVDSERYVDLVKMIQRRNNDPSKQRMVKREEITVTTAAVAVEEAAPPEEEEDEDLAWRGKHSSPIKGGGSPSKVVSPSKAQPKKAISNDDISPPPQHSSAQAQWYWQSDNGWVAYAKDLNKEIESAFLAKKKSLKIDKERFIDYEHKRQCRSDNPSKFRLIRRDVLKPAVGGGGESSKQHTQRVSPPAQATPTQARGVWFWQGDDGKWHQYENDVSDKIEEAFKAKKSKAPVDDERFIDLQNSMQKRYDNSSRKRFVMRKEIHPKQSLTPEQLRKIEQNRQECLRKKAEKEKAERQQTKDQEEDDDILGAPVSKNVVDTEEDEPYNYLDDEDYYPKRENRRKAYRCGNKYLTLDDIPSWHETAREIIDARPLVVTRTSSYLINEAINKKIAILKGDITTLEVDAIVNAARPSLMGGGGVDGAIHLAAGEGLDRECAYLNGCNVGEAKLSQGYRLPAHFVIHTVGPIGEDKTALTNCYLSVLDIVEKYNIKSVAFCCISTGVYGYPPTKAANIALSTVREWMQKNQNYKKMDKVIFCLFLEEDEILYQKLMQFYFPVDPATLPTTPAKKPVADRSSEKKDKQSTSKHKFLEEDDEDNHVSYDNFDADDVL